MGQYAKYVIWPKHVLYSWRAAEMLFTAHCMFTNHIAGQSWKSMIPVFTPFLGHGGVHALSRSWASFVPCTGLSCANTCVGRAVDSIVDHLWSTEERTAEGSRKLTLRRQAGHPGFLRLVWCGNGAFYYSNYHRACTRISEVLEKSLQWVEPRTYAQKQLGEVVVWTLEKTLKKCILIFPKGNLSSFFWIWCWVEVLHSSNSVSPESLSLSSSSPVEALVGYRSGGV